MNNFLRNVVALLLAISVVCPAVASGADHWIIAPQLCRGRAHSEAAKAARWQFDPEQRVSLASVDSGTMFTSVFPGEASNFVVDVKLRLADGSQCRLTLGDATFDVTNSGHRTELLTGEKEHGIDNNADSGDWTLLTVKRREGMMSAHLNGQHALDLGSDIRAIENIGLQSTRGTIAVSSFVLTGDLQQRNLTNR